jgi:1,4-alpha-glucan branching enzyme
MPASTQPGMGAVPIQQGVTFRVWAPFACAVSAAGSFNNWSKTATPLAAEGNGYWSADEPAAAIGDQYKFVLENRDTGAELWKNDPYARELTQSNGNSVIADPNFQWTSVDYSAPPWNELVIYEVHVGTFLSDPSSPAKRGTFASLITKLDYLADLGINAIEIMASGEFATDVSWGYNPSYIFAIESSYGGPNGFRNLVDQAHQRGIAVIFDVVYNHLGPQDLDMWQFDGWSQDGHGGIYFYNDRRRETPWGDTRPDYGRIEVRQYFRDNALRWCDTRYVDGLRWDATAWIRNIYGNNNDPGNDIPEGWQLMQQINGELARQPLWNMKISIAEDMKDNEWLTKDERDMGAGFDAQWDASFVHTIRAAIIPSDDNQRDMYAVRNAILHRYNNNAFERVVYTESHDEDANGHSRVPEEIWPGKADSYFSKKRSTLGLALVFTAPGIPMMFQGQEFLEDRWFNDQVELDWRKADHNGGIVSLCRDSIRLRRNWFNNTRGLRGQNVNVHHVNAYDKVIAFHRWDQGGCGDDVVVVANMANRGYESYNLGFPRPGTWKVRFNSDWGGYSPDFCNHFSYDTVAYAGDKDGMSYDANVGIGPYSVLVLSQDI